MAAFVADGLTERRGLPECPQDAQQLRGLFRRPPRAVDAGKIGRQVHHGAKTEFHGVGFPRGEVRRKGLLQRFWKDLGFIPAEIVAPENLGLDIAAPAVLVPMQVDQHLLHQDRAVVVERLTQSGMRSVSAACL